MTKELNIIRSYAVDSLNYGRKSGNKNAIQRGQDVLFSCDQISDYYAKVNTILNHSKGQQLALDQIESKMVDVYAEKLAPENFKSHHEWLKAIDNFFYE